MDAKGRLQTSDFYGGIFQITQNKRDEGVVVLKLFGGNFSKCPKVKLPRVSKGPKVVRQLWGSGKGQFRTQGRFSSATVRGTTWLTADQCGATLTKVTEGKIAVRDFVKRKTIVIRAGRSYLARARR